MNFWKSSRVDPFSATMGSAQFERKEVPLGHSSEGWRIWPQHHCALGWGAPKKWGHNSDSICQREILSGHRTQK